MTAPVVAARAPAAVGPSLGALWFAFLGGPAAWSVQELVDYMVLAHSCYPLTDPLAIPTVRAWTAGAVVWCVTLIVTLVALGVAVRATRQTTAEAHGFTIASAASHRANARRYLAFGGILLSCLFAALIVYNGIAMLGTRGCV